MRGVSSLEELCATAKNRGMDKLALTDINDRHGQISLSMPPGVRAQHAAPLPKPENYDEGTMLRHEVETLGFLASHHPLVLHMAALKPRTWVSAKDLPEARGFMFL